MTLGDHPEEEGFRGRKFLAAGGALVSGNLLNLIILFLQGVLLARALGVSGFGLYSAATAAAALAVGLFGFRTADALTRSLTLVRGDGGTRVRRTLIIAAISADFATFGLGLAAVTLAGNWLAVRIAGSADAAGLFVLASLSAFLGFAMNSFTAVARDRRHFVLLGYIVPSVRGAELGALGALAAAGTLTLWAALVVAAVRSAIGLAILLIYIVATCRNEALRETGGTSASARPVMREALLPFWRFMAASFLWSVATALPKNLDVVVLGIYRSPEECGYYRLAKNLVGFGQSAGSTLFSLIYREFLDIIAKERWKDALAFARSIGFPLAGIALAGGLAGGVLAPWIISLVYGPDYLPATLLVRIMLAGGVATVGAFWGQALILALGQIRYNTVVVTGLSLVAAAAYFPASLAAGAIGAAAVSSAFWLLTNGAAAARGLRTLREKAGS